MPKDFCIIEIKDGKIVNKTPLAKMLRGVKDGRYMMEVISFNKRSIPQNRYLHGLLIPEFRKALNSVGYDEVKTDGQAKLILKSMFLTTEIASKETCEMIKYVKDTSDLTKVEMMTLVEDVIKFCAENMNYQIPYPNEQLIMSYGE